MLNRYGDEATAEGTKRAEELAADGDLGGVAVLAARYRRNQATRDHSAVRVSTLEGWRVGLARVSPDAVRSSFGFLEYQIWGEEPVIIGFGEPEPLP